MEITQSDVHRLFEYDGFDLRRKCSHARGKAGKLAGTINGSGYRQISVRRKIYNAHRLIWLYVHNELPACDVDHINGIRSDNRIENLRLASRSQNLQNIKRPRSDNKTGFIGVYFHNARQKFIASIMTEGKSTFLGEFASAASAGAAYLAAKRTLHSFNTI